MKDSTYMTWAKHHAGARYNLANSGILGCTIHELPLSERDILINGPNHEGYAPLHEAIAQKYDTTPESVITAQGTSMANFLAMATVLERGDEVLIERPTYDPLLAVAEYLGVIVRRFERRFEEGYSVDLEQIRSVITPRTKLIVLTSPHNPSAVPVDPDTLIEIGRLAAETGARVLVDEAYRDILEPLPVMAASLGPQFISTSSLTKSHGLSGLRCGWVISEPPLIERMRRLNDIFGAVGPLSSENFSVVAFRNLEALERRTRSILDPNISLVHSFIEEHREYLDCVVPPRSMMLFPKLVKEEDSQALHDRLRAYDTSIVPGVFFESPRHFRLGFAVRTEDVKAGLERLSTALKNVMLLQSR
jgi:aspartate/methionine/tyrosine aminotransferase